MLQIKNKINNQIILYKVHIEVVVQQAVHRPCPEAISRRPLLGQLFEGLLKHPGKHGPSGSTYHRVPITRTDKIIVLNNPAYEIIEKKF